MTLRLLSMSPPDEFQSMGVFLFLNEDSKLIDEDSKLIDFIGPETWFIFDALNLDKNWLYNSPESWSCNKGRKFVANMKAINDAAKRGVKLHSDYASILTENEEQRASLLQVVEKHQKQYVDRKKSILALTSTH